MKERRNTQPLVVRCKLVLVGDVQCGKTAMLQVLAKDCYPEVCSNVAGVCEKWTKKMKLFCVFSLISVLLKWLNVAEGGGENQCVCCSHIFMRIFIKFRPRGLFYRNTLKCIGFFYGMINANVFPTRVWLLHMILACAEHSLQLQWFMWLIDWSEKFLQIEGKKTFIRLIIFDWSLSACFRVALISQMNPITCSWLTDTSPLMAPCC